MSKWNYHINIGDIWGNDDLSFKERRDQIVARIKESRAYHVAQRHVDNGTDGNDNYYHEEFIDNVQWLSESKHEDEFDCYWSGIYDYCDDRRIWIDLWKGPES